MKKLHVVGSVVLCLLGGCAAIERQLEIEATGAQYSTTLATAPVALFAETPSATRRIIADWCGGVTELPSEVAFEDLAAAFGSGFSIEWSLESQSARAVACTSTHDYSTRHKPMSVLDNANEVRGDLGLEPVGGRVTRDFVYEWVTFAVAGNAQGTCVVGSPEVKRNDAERRTGSYSDLEAILAELGGTVSPEIRAACLGNADAGMRTSNDCAGDTDTGYAAGRSPGTRSSAPLPSVPTTWWRSGAACRRVGQGARQAGRAKRPGPRR